MEIKENHIRKVVNNVIKEYVGDNGEFGKPYLDSFPSFVRHEKKKKHRSYINMDDGDWSCAGDSNIDPTIY